MFVQFDQELFAVVVCHAPCHFRRINLSVPAKLRALHAHRLQGQKSSRAKREKMATLHRTVQ